MRRAIVHDNDVEFWAEVKEAANIHMNPSYWKTVLKPKPLPEDKEEVTK
jgi:hypothetical protein